MTERCELERFAFGNAIITSTGSLILQESEAVVLKSSARFAQITGEQMSTYNVPADVPNDLIDTYIQNMNAATAGTGKMNLFACDQKIEHLNDDFYDGGKKIPATSNDPGHLFEIGQRCMMLEQSAYWQVSLALSRTMLVIIAIYRIWLN